MSPARRFSMTRSVITVVAMTVAACSGDSNRPIPDNDLPAITSLDPGYAVEGDGAFDLFVHGQGFNMDSVVRWSGTDRVTTLTNPSPGVFVLRAAIHSLDVAAQTTAQITVFNPAPGGGVSNSVNFVVYDPSALNPVPTVSTTDPTFVTHGVQATITVHGTGFVGGSTVTWKPAATSNEYTETTITIVNSSELTVVIPALHIPNTGSATLKVVNPPPGGGASGGHTVSIL